jgi:glutamyl-tRNA synthetase
MKISHVIRGEDHLSNSSKHVELFKAFGVTPPVFAHMPLILKDPAMGKGKMSKRDKGSLIEEYQERFYLPAAVRNAITLLGWNPKDDREILEIGEIIELFDIKDIQKGAARFDEKKMAHINGEYLKKLPVESYAWFARPILTEKGIADEKLDEDYLQRVLALSQEKITSLEGLADFVVYFFMDEFPKDEKTSAKVLKKGNGAELLAQVKEALFAIDSHSWNVESITQAYDNLATRNGQEKPFQWWPITRFAVSGMGSGPDFVPMLEVLGKERVLNRIDKMHSELN